MLSKRNFSPLLDPAEFTIPRLSDDAEYRAAQAAVTDAEKVMLAAERSHAEAETPAHQRNTWRDVENARAALTVASEKLAAVASGKSLEVCRALRPEQQRYLEALLEALEAAADAFACLAGLEARILAAGHAIRSDVLGVALPPAIYQLGSADDFASQLSQFRRRLQAEGIRNDRHY